jgi:hypothetical protein
MLVDGKVVVEEKVYLTQVQLKVKEYNLIQLALWTLKNQVNEEMSKTNDLTDINELYVYAQEITDLKYDLQEAFAVDMDVPLKF